MAKGQMDHLDQLEAESIFILREAYKKLGKLGMLWSNDNYSPFF